MTAPFAALFAGALVYALFDWRRGLLLCLAIGFLQDPARKLATGQPVYFVVLVAVAFSVTIVGVYFRGGRLGLWRILRWFPRMRAPVVAFLAVVLVQCVHTFARTGNPILTGLGLLAYLSPPLALLLGDHYCSDFRNLRRWILAYLLGAAVVAASVLAQFSGYEPAAFGAIGIEYVYGKSGAVRMMSGLMRSSEIAAWHLAAGACILIAVAAAARTLRVRVVAIAGFLAFLIAVALTGRRKMLAEILLFLAVYGFLVSQYRRGGSRVAQSAAAVVFVGILALQLFGGSGQVAELAPYLGRGATIVGDSTERLYSMTVGQFRWIVLQNGWLGSGAGTGAQGSQYFGGGTGIVGGAAEGGLGKVLAELGLPGLFAITWLGVAIARAILRIARYARRTPPEQALLLYGLIAFLPANAAVFLTAHQVYGDPFVLIVLGLVSGTILAAPRMWLAQQAAGAEQSPSAPGPRRPARGRAA